MKMKYKIAHMKVAYVYAELTHCTRRKVGCLIVKDGTPIAYGYNGTPAGEDNCCECDAGFTKPNVIHAEDNALRKLTRSTESAVGASMFVTLAPCLVCAPRIVDARIKEVYYSELSNREDFDDGIKYLEKHGIPTHKLVI